jgi:hypothetical protein
MKTSPTGIGEQAIRLQQLFRNDRNMTVDFSLALINEGYDSF